MIVLTRPYQDSLKLKQRIENECSKKCYVQPLLEIKILKKEINIPADSVVIITSANGIRALAENTKTRDQNVVTVGNESAKEAEDLGFLNVISAVAKDENSSEINLVKYIIENIPTKKPIIHISGNIVKGGIEKNLQERGYNYSKLVLYNSNSVNFSDEFIDSIKQNTFSEFSFFSARTSSLFSEQIIKNNLSQYLNDKVAFCFSDDVLSGLSSVNFKEIYIPEVTNTENFIKLLCGK